MKHCCGEAKKTAKKAQVLSLKDAVAYQAGTIVSRELLHKRSGSLTLFAFAAGQELSEHTAPFDALVHVLEGMAEVLIDAVPHTVRAGEMIIMPAHRPHALKAVSRFKMLLVMVR
jgi:quercetin dioxygenase-like cupin family protein